MEDNGGTKLTGIRQIVRLKELLHKWQAVTLSPKAGASHHHQQQQEESHHHHHHFRCSSDDGSGHHQHGGISPAISRRLMGASSYCDSDEDSCHSPEPPHDVPKGYLAVYVGPELRRFIIPTSYLSDPVFKVLLEKVEEEFGFDHSGGLTIPCEIETFKYLLNYLDTHQNDQLDHHHQEHNSGGTSSVAVEE